MQTHTSNTAEPHRSSEDHVSSFSRLLEGPRRIVQSLNAHEGLNTQWLIAVFAIALLLIFLRDPSLFTRPQFWAEDGKIWFAQAYNQGWLHSLTIPLSGYLCILPRLAAGAALFVPFRWAPLILSLEGILLQALPVPILLSARCRNWAPLSFRLLFAAVYVGIPDARDIHVVCTNGLWHLAVVATLLAFSAAPRSLFGRAFDLITFALLTVTGPFGVLLTPFLFAFWWSRRQRWSLVLLATLIAGSLLQLIVMHHNQAARHPGYLGATVARFIRMVGGNIFLGALRGSVAYGQKYSVLPCLVVFLIGLALIAYCSRRASLEVRLFFLFCLGVLVASLRSPLILSTSESYWVVMLRVASLRYWYFPSLIFLWSLLWCACYSHSRIFKAAGLLLALMLVQGIIRDWRIPPLEDLRYPEYAAQFEAATPGTYIKIPLNPPPMWCMELIKK